MRDVAKLAAVSHQTVSRVVNTPDLVRPATRERVFAAIAALDYRPLSAARALSTRRSSVIGVVDSGSQVLGQAHLLNSVERAARLSGFSTHVAIVEDEAEDAVRDAFRRLVHSDVEGIVVMGNTDTMVEAAEVAGASVPVAIVSAPRTRHSQVIHVGVDSVAAGSAATQHLIDQGCVRIAHVSGPRHWNDAEGRIEGWRVALEEHDLAPAGLYVGDWSPESGYEAGLRIIAKGATDGIFVGNDHMALGLLWAIHEHCIRAPQDIAVVGFDDLVGAAVFTPPLTTMRQPFEQIGEKCIAQLLTMIEGKGAHDVTLQASLVVRNSSLRLAHQLPRQPFAD
jgi:DNA-binding LacI/PurR family transcriptional regulator